MLSALGRRLYFPKGILTQGAEAKQKAHRLNATIGIATENGAPMHLPSIAAHLVDVSPDEAFNYAPPAGQQKLRERWRDKMIAENPGLAGRAFGLPIVTSAITHGLMLAGDLFVDPGDVIVLPDKLWGNYRLTYEVRLGARILTHPFFAGDGFDCAGFAAAIEEAAGARDKVIALLNFPNNPTGYMPTEAESRSIADTLLRAGRARHARGRAARRRVLRALLSPGPRVGDALAVRRPREPAPEPARDPARRRHQGAVRLGPALRLHHVRPRPRRERPGGVRGPRGQGEGRRAQRGLERAPALPDARGEGARVARDRARARREERDPAPARGEGLRGGARAALPRELARLPVQQRVLHVRGARGGARPSASGCTCSTSTASARSRRAATTSGSRSRASRWTRWRRCSRPSTARFRNCVPPDNSRSSR